MGGSLSLSLLPCLRIFVNFVSASRGLRPVFAVTCVEEWIFCL